MVYGLALGGGGSRGSYEIGVLKALEEMNIEIGAIAGTSIGAVNAAAYLMGDLELVENIWRSLTRGSLLRFKDMNIPEVIKKRGFDYDSLMKILKDVLSEEVIRKNPIDLGIVTYNLTQREPVIIFKADIPEGMLIDYVAASANHPSFRRLVIDGDQYIDGAVYDNIPIGPLYNKGYRNIISVDLDAIGMDKNMDATFNHVSIKPHTPLGSILFPDPPTIAKNISYGFMDTLKAFHKLHGYGYYLRSLDSSSLISPLNALEIKEFNYMMTPLFIDKAFDNYRHQLDAEFSFLLASLLIAAETLEVDNCKIYESPDHLLEKVILVLKDPLHLNNMNPLTHKIIFGDFDSLALKALSLTSPKLIITNIFLKIIQNRILGV